MNRLKGDISGISGDLDNSIRDIASTSRSLDDLKNTFLLRREDVDQIFADQAEAAKLTLVKHLFDIWLAANGRTAFDLAEQDITDAVANLGDDVLSGAWEDLRSATQAFLDAPSGSPQETTLAATFLNEVDTFGGFLRQKLVKTVS